jgi:hypothetical protein
VSEPPTEERSSERGGPKVRSAEGEATREVVSERSELTYKRNQSGTRKKSGDTINDNSFHFLQVGFSANVN